MQAEFGAYLTHDFATVSHILRAHSWYKDGLSNGRRADNDLQVSHFRCATPLSYHTIQS